MKRKYWPGENALDHRLRICPDCPWFRIVGMVADIHQKALEVDVRPEYYVPFDQLPQALPFAPPQDLAVRTAGDPAAALWTLPGEPQNALVGTLPNAREANAG